MKKKFNLGILILIFFFKFNLLFSQEFIEPNEKKACSNFYNAVKNDELPFLKGIWPFYVYEDFGFYLKSYYDSKTKEWIFVKDKNDNFIIGPVYSLETLKYLKPGDSIININDKQVKTIEEFNKIYDLDNITITLKNDLDKLNVVKLKKKKTD